MAHDGTSDHPAMNRYVRKASIMTRRRTAWLAAVLLLAAAEPIPAASHWTRELGVLPAKGGEEAPNFVLPAVDGTRVELRALRSKVVLLSFGVTW
jgi:cytochrome oxidase Cu insertion factor (SCO1/SenC/PrrC family)